MIDDFELFDILGALVLGITIGFICGVVVLYSNIDYDKFCPECGHQYKTEIEYCSYDGSELRMIGENNEIR